MRPFKELVNAHVGSTFLICGNGTSIDTLRREDYEQLKARGIITMGCNRIANLEESPSAFIPHYYVNLERDAYDKRFSLDKHRNELTWVRDGDIYAPNLEADYGYRRFPQKWGFNAVRDGRVAIGTMSTLPMMSMAYQMGAARIVLLGLDMCAEPGTGRMRFVDDPIGGNFYAQEDDAVRKLLLTEVMPSWFNRFRENGVLIQDGSPFGVLQGIEKVDVTSLP